MAGQSDSIRRNLDGMSTNRYVIIIERVRVLIRKRWARPFLIPMLVSYIGRQLALRACCGVPDSFRPYTVKGVQKFYRDTGFDANFAAAARRYCNKARSIERLEVLVFALSEAQEFARARDVIENEISARDRERPNVIRARTLLAFELARYAEVIESVAQSIAICPEETRRHYDFLKGAFAAGMCLQRDLALEFVGRQFGAVADDLAVAEPVDLDRVRRLIIERTIETIILKLSVETLGDPNQRIGVFFLSSTEALGHAILDPYHFLALNRGRFDVVLFIGPHHDAYRRASRVCLEIVEQYGTYVGTDDVMLQNLSWMSLGSITIGSIEIVIENYWSLLREVTHRSSDSHNAFEHNAWHMTLPSNFERDGRAFSAVHGIVDDKPIIVLHVRESGYHGLRKQGYRDADIRDYEVSIRYLLDSGYQVIRIGDERMSRLPLDAPGYLELPFLNGYNPRLDPYFIARSSFMIGSQSGPCAYARALGLPVLSVNAVYHYTLLPAMDEMACFKRYLKHENGRARDLSPDEILGDRLSHYDNAHQFAGAGIELQCASSSEILDAVSAMMEWVAQPDRPETPEQDHFRTLAAQTALVLEESGAANPPIADYLGIALPRYRVSPGAARRPASVPMRNETAGRQTNSA
jgi:putative glycosyltransferase (TIGR04372 family)